MNRAYVYCFYADRLLRYQRPRPLPPGTYRLQAATADYVANDNNGDGLVGIIKYAVYNDFGGHTGDYQFKKIYAEEAVR